MEVPVLNLRQPPIWRRVAPVLRSTVDVGRRLVHQRAQPIKGLGARMRGSEQPGSWPRS
jgi:hypothetical protein